MIAMSEPTAVFVVEKRVHKVFSETAVRLKVFRNRLPLVG